MFPQQNPAYNPNTNYVDPSGTRYSESDQELYDKILQPSGKTAERIVLIWDEEHQKWVKKSLRSAFKELNLPDITSGNLEGPPMTTKYAWHSLNHIKILQQLHLKSGCDVSDMIDFHTDLLLTHSSLSKAQGGALLKALTVKELKQIQEIRSKPLPEDENRGGIFGFLKKKN